MAMTDYQGMSEAAKAYRFPGEHMYKGVTYSGLFPASSLRGIEEDLQLGSQDIVVASFPKSGMLKSLSEPMLTDYQCCDIQLRAIP